MMVFMIQETTSPFVILAVCAAIGALKYAWHTDQSLKQLDWYNGLGFYQQPQNRHYAEREAENVDRYSFISNLLAVSCALIVGLSGLVK